MFARIKPYIHKLLRKSEKYTKTDMRHIFKSSAWLVSSQFISAITSLLFAVAVSYFLTKEAYGTYKYALSMAAAISIFSLPGVGAAIIKAVSSGKEGSLQQGIKLRLKWGLIGIILGIVVGLYYLVQGNSTLGIIFIIIGITTPVSEALVSYLAFLNGKKEFRVIAISNIVSQLIGYTAIILVIFITNNPLYIVATYCFVWLTLRYALYLYTKNKYQLNQAVDSEMSRNSKHISVMEIANIAANHIDKLLLWHFTGAGAVAIYSIASAIPNQAVSVIKNVKIISQPSLVNTSEEVIAKSFVRRIIIIFITINIIILGYYFLSPLLFTYLFPTYVDAIPYSQALIISSYGALSYYVLAILEAKMKTHTLYKVTGLMYGTQIALYIICIPLWGIWGAVIAKITGQIFSGFVAFLSVYRKK